MRKDGSASPTGFQLASGRIGNAAMPSREQGEMDERLRARRERPDRPVRSTRSRRTSSSWKNSMHVVQTAADPPNHGRIILAMIGCTWNSRNAERRMVTA